MVLVDTPGLAEVRGEARAAEAAEAAKNADLVLFVVDGPLKAYESRIARSARGDGEADRRLPQQGRLVRCAAARRAAAADCRAGGAGGEGGRRGGRAQSGPPRGGACMCSPTAREQEEEVAVEPDIGPLARRMMSIVERDGRELLLANLLLQSRGLVDEAKERVLAALDERADEVISKYMWAAGGAAAINPFPLLDLAGGSAITVKMVLDLAGVYQQKIDADTIVTLLGQLGKNLVAMVGATAAAPALAAAIGSLLKTVPGHRHDRRRRGARIGAGARDAVDRPRVLRILPQRDAAAAGRVGRAGAARVGRGHAAGAASQIDPVGPRAAGEGPELMSSDRQDEESPTMAATADVSRSRVGLDSDYEAAMSSVRDAIEQLSRLQPGGARRAATRSRSVARDGREARGRQGRDRRVRRDQHRQDRR